MSKLSLIATTLAALTALSASEANATKVLRYPDVHKDRVVFTHGGDLWIASTEGGEARRLTSHPGLEVFAKFSPDGSAIAFTGQYDGDEQVYVVPANGGEPKRLTYYPARGPLPARWGYDNQVYGWTPDGKSVLFRGLRDHWTVSASRLYTVPATGGLPVPLAPSVAGAGALSPDGTKLFYSPLFRDFRTWKRYQGGWAQDLYVYDLAKNTLEAITKDPRTDRDPMWIGDALFFASDRDDRLNLYRFDLGTKKTTQLTKHTDADVRWPSEGPDGKIVYELDGELHIFDTQRGADRKISIQVPSDRLAARARDVSVADLVESFAVSPNGGRELFVARGDVFDAPAEKGVTRNLTHSSNAHEREATWSPDGKRVAFISDITGEEELWMMDRDTGEHLQLTFDSKARMYRPRWSPDDRTLAYSDKDGRLYVVDLKTRTKTQVADQPVFEVGRYEWSPRGGFLAFGMRDSNFFESIYIYSLKDGKTHRVTSGDFNESGTTWDPSGDYLYYLGDRDFRPQMGVFDFNYVSNQETGIYALALRKDVKSPFPIKDDAATKDDDTKKDEKEKGEGKKKDEEKDLSALEALRKKGFIEIDFDGLSQRVTQAPLPTSNYSDLEVTATHILVIDRGPPFLGRDDIGAKLIAYDRTKEKSKVLAENVDGYSVSADGMVVVARVKNEFMRFDLSKEEEGKKIPTGGLVARIDPKAEWATIFNEVWRRFRDYFYVENMHGYDWAAVREQYRAQLNDISHRDDLNDLLGQMVAELEVSHAYVAGGDLGLPPRPNVALPGARFELDTKAGRYRIASIFEGQNEEALYRSPLTEVGVDASVGDYLLAVNGRELLVDDNPYQLLTVPAGAPVELLLNAKPTRRGAKKVLINPISSEQSLVYLAFVLDQRRRVREATDGKVGYIHLPDMGEGGLREFTKWYYPQIRKDAMIVDVRANGGGFVSQMIIDRLSRKVLGTGFGRTSDYQETYPFAAMAGPMVCVMNETSGSDGDIFPWAFKAAGLGPLIGKRSWGGVVGINDHGPVLDGGSVFVPEFSTNGRDGRYIIEGHGVDPDIVVDNDPIAVSKGRDPQLERALQEVKALLQKAQPLPKRPAAPVKAKPKK